MVSSNNNNRKPKKYTVDNYDYSRICNFPGCEEATEICRKCFERTGGKEILGHRHEHLKLIQTTYKGKKTKRYEETAEDIKVTIKIMHGHFALKKGTKIPELDTGRNLMCKVGERWANKLKETYLARKLNDRKRAIPDYVEGDSDDN